MLRFGLAALLIVAGAAQAEMTTSPRPQPRPAVALVSQPAVTRPMPRPAAFDSIPRAVPEPTLASVPQALTAPPLPVASAIRPRPRPSTIAPMRDAVPPSTPDAEVTLLPDPDPAPRVRPLLRPAALAAPVPALLTVTVSRATSQTMRPKPRPDVLQASAPVRPESGALGGLFGTRKPKKPSTTDGFVCGDPDIKGDELAPVTSRVKGCGIDEPVRVTSIDGVRLRGSATIDCGTAQALKTWINKGMRPAFTKDVVELHIAGSYVCRPRNNQRGNKISEHGRGKAIDISAFVFANGTEWTIQRDYNRQIRKAHKAACGIFGTTLGPGSDGYHEDHLHFDTAAYRNGPYCR